MYIEHLLYALYTTAEVLPTLSSSPGVTERRQPGVAGGVGKAFQRQTVFNPSMDLMAKDKNKLVTQRTLLWSPLPFVSVPLFLT